MREPAGSGAFDHTLHGGSAPTRMQWLFREETALPVAVQRWDLPPGGSEGVHAHPPGDEALEELYVLLEGQATMHVDDATYELAPGDAVLAPAGSRHDLQNTGAGGARLVVVWGRPGSGVDWSRYASGVASRAAADEARPRA